MLLAAECPFDLGRQTCSAPELCEKARAVRLVVCGNELTRGKRERLLVGGVAVGDRLGSVQSYSTVPVDSVDISHLGGPAGTPLDPAHGLLTATLQVSNARSRGLFEGRLEGLRKVRENQLGAEAPV